MHVSRQGSVGWEGLKVLIADDQRLAVDVLRDMLNQLGVAAVLTAESGAEALQQAEKHGKTIDIFICDWNMPRMSGLELLDKLRASLLTTPFLMVTGHSDIAGLIESRHPEAASYILKPFSLFELQNKIADVLAEN